MPVSNLRWVSVLLLLGLVVSPLLGQNRVDKAEALAHVVRRVEPKAPAGAATADISGKVYADVIVRVDGTVESVEILSGAAMLRTPVTSALKQWTFRPFLENGRPARIITLIETDFPDVGTDEQRIYEGYRSSEFTCRRQLESSPQSAIAARDGALRFAKRLPSERLIERSEVLSMLGQAYLLNRRFSEAVAPFEEALAVREQSSGPNDESVAAMYELVAIAHSALQNLTKANEAMAAAVRSYEGAIEKLPSYRSLYTPRLRATLRRYADLKTAAGDTAAANALRAKADSLALPAPVPQPDPGEPMKIISGVRAMGINGPRLTEDDVQKIRALMPAGAPPVWMVIADRVGTYGPLSWDVLVFLEPDSISPEIRMGRAITMTANLPAEDAFSSPKTWQQRVITGRYAQVPLPGHDPKEIASEVDFNRPFRLIEFNNEPFSAEDISRIVDFIRHQAATTPPNRQLFATDVQPWPIQEILRWGPMEAEVVLLSTSGRRNQLIRVRMGADMSILYMR